MLGSCDNVKLLLACEVDELDRVARNTDCKVCVLGLFGMFHTILKLFNAENIYIKVVSALVKVAVEDMPEVINSLAVVVAESVGADCLCI